jgi:RNA polymerase sigma-70 factor (ECF subfamily)
VLTDSELMATVPRLRKQALHLCRSHQDVDDLVQETLMRAWRARTSFDGTNLLAWVHAIMRNYYYESCRRRKRRSFVSLDDLPEPSIGPDNTIDLERALSQLPDKQAVVVLAVGINGMSYDEAASSLNIPLGTVKSRLSRARALLDSAGFD